MDNIELKTPEGYFEDSFARTMVGVSWIRKRRMAAFGAVAVLFVIFGITYSSIRGKNALEEKEYIALQTEMADYDIFLEIN